MKYITVEHYINLPIATFSLLNHHQLCYDTVALPSPDGPLQESDIADIPVMKIVRRTAASREYQTPSRPLTQNGMRYATSLEKQTTPFVRPT
jgi:hypothetical protein